MRPHIGLIFNPASGRARSASIAAQSRLILTRRGARVTPLKTAYAGHARELARTHASRVDLLCSFGGDGTLNEVVNGVIDSGHPTPVAMIPTGTANLVAKELGLPQSLAGQLEIALGGTLRALDVGEATTQGPQRPRRFLLCASVGFDAEAVRQVHTVRTPGRFGKRTYLLPVLRSVLSDPRHPLTVTIDGHVTSTRATYVLIGNMRHYAGPFMPHPAAKPDDGLLDVLSIRLPSLFTTLLFMSSAMLRMVQALPFSTFHRGHTVRVHSASPVPTQFDGDDGGDLPLDVSILPRAVQLCVPPLMRPCR